MKKTTTTATPTVQKTPAESCEEMIKSITDWIRWRTESSIKAYEDLKDKFVAGVVQNAEYQIHWNAEPLVKAENAMVHYKNLDACIKIAGLLEGLKAWHKDLHNTVLRGSFDHHCTSAIVNEIEIWKATVVLDLYKEWDGNVKRLELAHQLLKDKVYSDAVNGNADQK